MTDTARRGKRRIEWPTLALTFVVYGGWLALTFWHDRLPLWLLAALGGWVIAWHGSLQHEIIHGHPTGWRRVNRLIGVPPLALWLPFELYRASHLRHHRDDRLTDPLDDPESYYWTRDGWREIGPVGRALVRAQTTLLGRLAVGPFWSIGRFLGLEAAAVVRGRPGARRVWARHALAVGAVLLWLEAVCGLSVGLYLLAFVYPGTALLLVRSFAEHRADEAGPGRTAIVEGSTLLGVLFLFNNLHAAHHARPALPWYRLPGWYRENRDGLVAANGGLVYRGYGEVLRRYLLRAHDRPLHPVSRARRRAA